MDLTGQVSDACVILTWTPNTTDADLAGYMVYRENGSRVAALVDAPLSQNWFQDDSPVLDASNVYRVTSVDLNGNESTSITLQMVVEQEDPAGQDLHPMTM